MEREGEGAPGTARKKEVSLSIQLEIAGETSYFVAKTRVAVLAVERLMKGRVFGWFAKSQALGSLVGGVKVHMA